MFAFCTCGSAIRNTLERQVTTKLCDAAGYSGVAAQETFLSASRAGTPLQPEQLAQAFGLGAANRNFGLFLVVHAELVRALKPGNDFLDPIDIDQIRTMSTPKQILVKAVQQLF